MDFDRPGTTLLNKDFIYTLLLNFTMLSWFFLRSFLRHFESYCYKMCQINSETSRVLSQHHQGIKALLDVVKASSWKRLHENKIVCRKSVSTVRTSGILTAHVVCQQTNLLISETWYVNHRLNKMFSDLILFG